MGMEPGSLVTWLPGKLTARMRRASTAHTAMEPGCQAPRKLAAMGPGPRTATIRNGATRLFGWKFQYATAAVIAPTVAAIALGRISPMMTVAPSRASRWAVAAPIPDAAPVMTARRSVNLPTPPPFKLSRSRCCRQGSRWAGSVKRVQIPASALRDLYTTGCD